MSSALLRSSLKLHIIESKLRILPSPSLRNTNMKPQKGRAWPRLYLPLPFQSKNAQNCTVVRRRVNPEVQALGPCSSKLQKPGRQAQQSCDCCREPESSSARTPMHPESCPSKNCTTPYILNPKPSSMEAW